MSDAPLSFAVSVPAPSAPGTHPDWVVRRPLVPIAIGSIAGILAGLYNPWLMAAVLASSLILSIRQILRGDRAGAVVLSAALLVSIFFVYRAGMQVRDHADGVALATRFSSRIWHVTPEPIGAPLASEKGLKTAVRIDRIETDDPAAVALIGRRIQVTIHPLADGTRPDPDRAFAGAVRILPEKDAVFPGAFSLANHARRQRILAYGIMREWTQEAPSSGPVELAVGTARRALVANTYTRYPGVTGAFLAALLFGERSRIPDSVTINFRVCGLSHLIAISGLNVGLVAGFAWVLFRHGLRRSHRGAALAAMGAILAYALVSGGQPSAVRATVMGLFYFAGFCIGRRNDLLNAMAGAAILILLENPLAVTDAGFLLSFVAVLFLSRVANEVAGMLSTRPVPANRSLGCRVRTAAAWLGREVWQLFVLGLAASAGTAPLSAQYFYLFSFSGLILNLFAIPWMAVVLVAGFAGQFTALFLDASVARVFAGIFAFPADVVLWLAEAARIHAPWAVGVNPPSTGALVAYYAGFVCLFCRRMFGFSAVRGLVLVAVGTAALLYSMRDAPPPPEDRLVILDTWSRTAILERRDGRVELFVRDSDELDDAITFIRWRHMRVSADRPLVLHVTDAAREECLSGLRLLLGPVEMASAATAVLQPDCTDAYAVRLTDSAGRSAVVRCDFPAVPSPAPATAEKADFRIVFLPGLGRNGWTAGRTLRARYDRMPDTRIRFLHTRDRRIWKALLPAATHQDITGLGALRFCLDNGLLRGEAGTPEGWTPLFSEYR